MLTNINVSTNNYNKNDEKDNCDALCDLVLFVQFKKREKYPWGSVNFSKVDTPLWVFFTFFKLCK